MSAETIQYTNPDEETVTKHYGSPEHDYGDIRYSRGERSESIDLVRVYLNGIGKTALLSAADEVELSQKIEAGLYAEKVLEATDLEGTLITENGDISPLKDFSEDDRKDYETVIKEGDAARQKMLEANLRLVVSFAKRYQARGGSGMPLLDLIQEGNLGLIRAMEKFDFAKGYKFSTYATWWIRQSITRGLADQARTIRLPVHVVEKVNKLHRTQRELNGELDREPTFEELGKEVDLDPQKVEEYLALARDSVSFSIAIGEHEDGGELGDFIADADEGNVVEKHVEFQAMQRDLGDLLVQSLTPREREVISMRFGLDDGNPMTLDQIGEVIGVSRERVRQIEKDAKEKLRDGPAGESLREYYVE